GAHLDRRRHPDLDEGGADPLPDAVASRPVGRHDRADGHDAVPGEEIGHVSDAPHVLVAIGPAVAQVGTQLGPHDVAVEDFDGAAVAGQAGRQRGRDGGLARRRKSGEPHDGAGHGRSNPRRRRMRRSIVPKTSESMRMPRISTINITEMSPALSANWRSNSSRLPIDGLLAMMTRSSPAIRLRHANAHPCLSPTRNDGHSAGNTTWR